MFDNETLDFFEFLHLDSHQFEFSEFLIRYSYILIKIYTIFEEKSSLVNINLFSWMIRNVSKILGEIGDAKDISDELLRDYGVNKVSELSLKSSSQYDEADVVFAYSYSIMELIQEHDLGDFYGAIAYQMFENSYYIDCLYHPVEKKDGDIKKYCM